VLIGRKPPSPDLAFCPALCIRPRSRWPPWGRRLGVPMRWTWPSAAAWPGLMKVAAVSPSAHERRTPSRNADELAASDPEPASSLGVFNRLARGW